MRQSDIEIWERIEARLRSVEWSKPKNTVRIASYDSGREPDAWAALCRNAAAAESHQSAPSKVGRLRRPLSSLPSISEDEKQEYDYLFKEREGFYLDAGMAPRCASKEINPHCCAYHAALLEIGCLEFFTHAHALPYALGMVRCVRPAPSPFFCERCQ